MRNRPVRKNGLPRAGPSLIPDPNKLSGLHGPRTRNDRDAMANVLTRPRRRVWAVNIASAAAVAIAALASGAALAAQGLTTAWSTGNPEARARLVAGDPPPGAPAAALTPVAAIEVELQPGWKTYWRFPGDAGGVPPVFDWSRSQNVRSAKVLFPAPQRIKDVTGDILGYTNVVTLPVVVEPLDSTKPVALKVTMEYGVCREICIPVTAEFSLDVPATARGPLPASVAAALDKVPRTAERRLTDDPKLVKTEVNLAGDKPSLAIEAEFPGGTAGADVYVESPNGYYIPLPKPRSAKDLGGGRLRFEIDLTGAVEPDQIRGKDAVVTIVSDRGLAEASFRFE